MADELAFRRSLEMAALWGNSNADGTKDEPGVRSEIQNGIEKSYNTAIASLYGGETIEDTSDEPDMSDPFWQAMERGLKKNKLPEVTTGE